MARWYCLSTRTECGCGTGTEGEWRASIAIAFLNSYRNSEHNRAKELVSEGGQRYCSLTSSEIAPEIREYERFSTCAANAYIAPIATNILATWRSRWAFHCSSCSQTAASPPLVLRVEQPIALVKSGPAAGAMGAAFLARQAGWNNVIAFDIGRTTGKP